MNDTTNKCPFSSFDANEKNHRKNIEPVWKEMQGCPQLPHSDKHGGHYIVTKYEEVSAAARNPKLFSSAANGIAIPDLHFDSRLIPVEIDPPHQTEYRSLLVKFVSNEAVQKHAPLLRSLAGGLLDKISGQSKIDFVKLFARPFPAMAVLTLLQVPNEDFDKLAYLIDTSIDGAEGEGRGGNQMKQAALELTAYLENLLSAKRSEPFDPDDILSTIVHTKLPTAPLGPKEQVAFTRLFIFGGFTTTTFALASAIRWLAEHPTDIKRLREHPELLDTAVDEFIRFSAPGTYLGRTVMADSTLGNTPLHKGDRVLLSYGAANRDPNVFDKADEVVLDRSPNRHMGFGHGPHGCMGLHLARLEIRIALEEILNRMGDFAMDPEGKIEWASGETQGMMNLPLLLQGKR